MADVYLQTVVESFKTTLTYFIATEVNISNDLTLLASLPLHRSSLHTPFKFSDA